MAIAKYGLIEIVIKINVQVSNYFYRDNRL